jgi:hypothetical protein
MKSRNISSLFHNEPKQWGLRGDPYLWDEMRLESTNVKLLENEILMKEYFYELFYKLTGYEITKNREIFIERYPYFIAGGISCGWWIVNGIPFIMERYKKIKLASEGIEYKIKDIYWSDEGWKGTENSIKNAEDRKLYNIKELVSKYHYYREQFFKMNYSNYIKEE